MIGFHFKSIKSKLMFWFLSIALLPLLIALIVTYTQRVNVIETRTFDKLIAIRDLKVKILNDWLDERTGDIINFSADKELTELELILKNTSFNQDDNKILDNCRRIMNRYMENYDAYSEIFILNPLNGDVIVSTDVHIEGDNRSQDYYFIETLRSEKLTIKDIYYSKYINNLTMDFSIPIPAVTENTPR